MINLKQSSSNELKASSNELKSFNFWKERKVMNVIVCVKQVPDTTEIKIDPVKKTLIRDGVPSILNPFDGYAVEAALRLKDKDANTKVVVVSMGPPQATAVLKEALSLGCDKAYLLSDRAFGGSDTLATSYIISNSIKEIEKREGCTFDIIMCGKQAIDGDTAQVGPEIAEHLGLPQVTYAWEITEAKEGSVVAKREVDDGYEMTEVKTPCLITFTKPNFDPRYATIKGKLAANKAEIPVLGAADVPMDLTKAGLGGSPTKVKKTFTPEVKTGGMVIKEETDEESVAKLTSLLIGANII